MANYFSDNADLQYYVDKGIDWGPLVEAVEMAQDDVDVPGMVESYREVLELLGTFAADEVAPYAEEIDRQDMEVKDGEVEVAPRLTKIFERINELDLHRLALPTELGGMNCPLMLYYLNAELMARADVGVMTHYGFHSGIALCLLFWSVEEGSTEIDPETYAIVKTRWHDAIEEMRDGKAWGSMDLTEPHAGSDLANLRSRAEQDGDGNWWLTGSKIFITSGHGKYHIVIARSEDPEEAEGLKGLSLFLVEAYSDKDGERVRHSTVERVDEKLGHHGSATVSISFDRSPAQLIGKRGEGFRLMLMLMNNARISVGFEGIGLCEAALRLARDYAQQRPSMGKTIDQHEMVADMLDEMETDVMGLRALAVRAAQDEELSRRATLTMKALPENHPKAVAAQREIRSRSMRSRQVTPLLKYLASEKAVEMARYCIQIHGGSGYMREYGAEKLLRDSLVLPIYEGTSQIQCLMAMKDNLLPIFKKPGAFFGSLISTWLTAWFSFNGAQRGVARVRLRSQQAMLNLIRRIAWAKFRSGGSMSQWDPKTDFAPAMLHAERLSNLLVDAQILDTLQGQAKRHPERAVVRDRYLERALPRSRALLHEIKTMGKRLLNQLKTTAASS